ncbi:transcriptional regulator GcvA [Pandoraea terrae]|nr:transcriptional regulator GcvA [Pandoraea terrae]
MKAPIFLNALRAFEASARHQSFSAAAEELNVTPAAVGQLVRSLEGWLGSPVFLRNGTGRARLIPTESALRALPDIRAGFDRLNLGFSRLKEGSATGVLTVTVSPAFAAKWLLSRIHRFQELCPETDVRLDTSLKLIDFAVQGIDIGVRYGSGCWPDLTAEKLLDEEVFPVCSPAYRKQHREIQSPKDLLDAALIHDLSVDSQAGFVTWDTWLNSVTGEQAPSARTGLTINNSASVLQAATDGRGIALARSVMAREDLASGRLVRLFSDISFPSKLAYYVVYRPECASLARLKAFRDWLMQEAQSSQASGT